MCDESAISFEDGDVVWVKVSNRWWPGEICSESRLPEGLLETKRKKPIAIVKFFQEDTYEFVKDLNHLMNYNCSKKNEFIKKGLELYRANNKHMEKFPSDVQTAEKITGGDENIIDKQDDVSERKKLNYAEIFGDQTKKVKKGKYHVGGRNSLVGRNSGGKTLIPRSSTKKKISMSPVKIPKDATPQKGLKLKDNYKKNVPSHESKIMLQSPNELKQQITPDSYKCHICNFTSSRQNVIILHTKTHTNPGQVVTTISETELEKATKDDRNVLNTKPSASSLTSRSHKYNPVIIIDDSESEDEPGKSVIFHGDAVEEPAEKSNKENILSTPKLTEEENDYSFTQVTEISFEKKKTEEEIRTEILADWSDGSSENGEQSISIHAEKSSEYVEESVKEVVRPVTPEQPEPIRLGEELAQLIHKESSESSSDDKLSSNSAAEGRSSPRKYRNIPKKDRRDIVLKDFNSGASSAFNNNGSNEDGEDIDSKSKSEDEISSSNKQSEEVPLEEKDESEEKIPSENAKTDTSASCDPPQTVKETVKTVQKSAISCFDFQDDEEDEDFFTSLSKLKKKYLSPDKNKDATENKVVAPDTKDDIEKKDEELSAEIDNLLNCTKFPELKVDAKPTVKPSTSSEIISREVRALPPKERGKRIFKSRNRSRYEDVPPSNAADTKSNSTIINLPSSQKVERKDEETKVLIQTSKEVDHAKAVIATETLNAENKNTVNVEVNVETNANADDTIIDQKGGDIEENVEELIIENTTEITTESKCYFENESENTHRELNVVPEAQGLSLNADISPKDEKKGSDQMLNKPKIEEDTINEAGSFEIGGQSVLIGESKTQSELAVAEALISIPNAFELSNSIKSSRNEMNTCDVTDSIEQDLNKLTGGTDDDNELDGNAVGSQENEAKLEEYEEVLQIIEESKENLEENDEASDAASPTNIQKEVEKNVGISEKSTWIGTRKRRRAHMKITPRKRIVLPSVESDIPVTYDSTEQLSAKDNVQSNDIVESEDEIQEELIQKPTLKPDDSLEIKISTPDKFSESEEVPRPQFSPLSPQISLKQEKAVNQTIEGQASPSKEENFNHSQFSPLSPSQPRYSPIKQITEKTDTSPIATDKEIDASAVSSQENDPSKGKKTFREEYEESFVQKYIKDAMMFESSEEIKLNINESEFNLQTQGNENAEKKEGTEEKDNDKDPDMGHRQVKSSKDTISEIRSFRLRRKNKYNIDQEKASPHTEVFVKENLVATEPMEVDKNVNLLKISETSFSSQEDKLLLATDDISDKGAISFVETTGKNKQIPKSGNSSDVEMKEYEQHHSKSAENTEVKGKESIKQPEISADRTLPTTMDTKEEDPCESNISIAENKSIEKIDEVTLAPQKLTSADVSKSPIVESFPSVSNIKNERQEYRIPKKRKQTFEDDIPSFVIEKPSPAIITVSATSKELHPPEKMSKLDTMIIEVKEKGNNKGRSKSEESFDIHNMPILLASDTVVASQAITAECADKVQLIVTSKTQGILSTDSISPSVTTSVTSHKNTTQTPTKSSMRSRKSAGPPSISTNNTATQSRATSSTTPSSTPQMTHQSSQIITAEGKEIGKDGKGNKFVIIKSGNSNKMIIRPDSPKAEQANVTTAAACNVICTQTVDNPRAAEVYPKMPTQKGQVMQQYQTGQMVITSKGAILSNSSDTLSNTTHAQIGGTTVINNSAPMRTTSRRRSSKSSSNIPSTSHPSTQSFQSGVNQIVVEQELLNNKVVAQKSGILAINHQELMPPPPAPMGKRVDMTDMEVERINSGRSRRSSQSKANSRYSGKNRKSDEMANRSIVTEPPSAAQRSETVKEQQQHQLQQLQQQQQQQIHKIQQQHQHMQHLQQQQQLQQQLQQQMRQKQEQQLQQQLQLQQAQQLKQQTKKSSQAKSTSHSSEKVSSTPLVLESPKLPENQNGKSVVNVLPISSSNLPPNVEVDESEMGSYVAVQATEPNVFYLCKHQGDEEGLIPVISQPLYLDQNNGTLVLPHQIPIEATEIETDEKLSEQEESQIVNVRISDEDSPEQRRILLSIEDNQDNQVVIDYETAVALINNSGGEDPVQLSVNDQLVSISIDTLAQAFGLSVDKETEQFIFTNIDLENSLQNAANPDILAAALAGTEVYQQQEIIGDVLVDPNNVSIVEQGIAFQPIDPPVTAAKATTNETNAILTQPPIMSTLEVPPNKKKAKLNSGANKVSETSLIGQNLDESLAKIGVTTQSSVVPSSLELPITVTNPAIAPKSTSNPILLEGIYTTGLSQASQMSPPISSAITNEQQEMSYEILTSSTVQSPQSSPTILNTNNRGSQQSTEFGVAQASSNASAASSYDDPAR